MSKDLMQFLGDQEERFKKLDTAKLLNFKQECLFARQQITKNDYTFKASQQNPQSLQAAILNVAAIGISLNPAQAHAYLVPRDGQICLDISYKGLVKLATDCGAILDCKSVLVYSEDTFKWRGPYKAPKHEADPFAEDRGDVKGAYNIAHMPDGRVMVDTVSREYIDKVRNTSKAKNGPWKTWPEEMMLKTATKHAYKSWPQTENRERLDRAIEVLHETEGMAFTLEQQATFLDLLRKEDALGFYLFNQTISESASFALSTSFDQGHKMKDKERAKELINKGIERMQNIALDYQAAVDSDDTQAIKEIREDFTDSEWEVMQKFLPGNLRGAA